MNQQFESLEDGSRILFDGKDVLVRRFDLNPGECLLFEDGLPRAILSLDDYRVKYRDGENEKIKTWKPGDVHWHSADSYQVENIGNTIAKFIVLTYK